MGPGRSLIDRFYELLGAGDEITAYLDAFLRRHRNCSLRSIDQFRETDDIVMWDAMLDTDDGVLQSTHVVVLATDGTIHRHIPHMPGYWGS